MQLEDNLFYVDGGLDRSAGIEGEVRCLGVWMFSTLMCVLNGTMSVYYGDTVKIYNRRSKQESNISPGKSQFWYSCTIKLPEIVKSKVVDLWPIVKFASAISKFKTRLILGLGYLMYQRYFWNMNTHISAVTSCFPGVLGELLEGSVHRQSLVVTRGFRRSLCRNSASFILAVRFAIKQSATSDPQKWTTLAYYHRVVFAPLHLCTIFTAYNISDKALLLFRSLLYSFVSQTEIGGSIQ